MSTEEADPRRAFEVHLAERAAKSRSHARKNDAACMVCYVVAIAGSFLATIGVAIGDLPKAAIAALTAVPGTALLANSVFSFERKCVWHRRRKIKFDALAMKLRYEGADVATLSKELREYEAKADLDYPRFGALSAGRKEDA
jgi:hypothetical protein